MRQAAKTKYMRKCRNWQTSKTKDLVIIAIVWVQVPSSALNNKTGIKQSVWSLSCCSKPKRALNPWFKVSPPARSARGMRSPDLTRSPLRSGRCRTDVLRTSCGLRSAPVVAEQTSPGRLATHLPQDFGCCGAGAPWFKVSPPARSARGMRSPGPHSVSAPLRSLQNRRPPDVLQPIFRKASVVAEQAPYID